MRAIRFLRTLGLLVSLAGVYQGFTNNIPLLDLTILVMVSLVIMSIPKGNKKTVNQKNSENLICLPIRSIGSLQGGKCCSMA